MRAFVDRIEDGTAVLLLGEDESVSVALPVSWLPAGIKEAAVLRLDARIDLGATAAGKAEVRELLEGMGNEP